MDVRDTLWPPWPRSVSLAYVDASAGRTASKRQRWRMRIANDWQ